MKRAFTASTLFVVAFLAIAFGCRSAGDVNKAETQQQFGVRMARMNLWREAMFRFKRAVEMDPDDAMAHNNLAVAYEANGDLESAAKEYREALRLDRSNEYIQKNYSRFVEFTSRAKKRNQPRPATADTTTTAPATETTATVVTPGTPGVYPRPNEPPPITPPGPPPTDTSATSPPPGGSR